MFELPKAERGYRIATDSMQENVANTMGNLLGGNVVHS